MRLAESIAAKLKGDIGHRFSGALLPSRKVLAGYYDVSESTMASAIALLARTKVLERRRGGCARILCAERVHPPQPQPRLPPQEKAARWIEDGISRTVFKAGEPLPKTSILASLIHTSTTAVITACRELERRKILRRTGRSYLVGKEPRPTGLSRQSADTVLMLMDRANTWTNLNTPRTARFGQVFAAELQQRSVAIKPVYVNDPGWHAPNLIVGRNAVHAHVKHLAHRYIGCLLPLSLRNECADLTDWVDDLLPLGKPVVWFDRYDERVDRLPSSRNFIRCHFSERSGVESVVKFLAERGHRTVTFPCSSSVDWHMRRLELLSEAANRYGLTVVSRPHDSFTWREVGVRRFSSSLRLFRAYGSAHTKNLLQEIDVDDSTIAKRISILLESGKSLSLDSLVQAILGTTRPGSALVSLFSAIAGTPLYLKYLADDRITAFIAPHAPEAAHQNNFLTALGISVPGQMSLISFDNDPLLQPFAIDTVDFGFGYLGYWAAHAFLQDLPIPRDKLGNCPARAAVIDNQTTEVPVARRKPLLPSVIRSEYPELFP